MTSTLGPWETERHADAYAEKCQQRANETGQRWMLTLRGELVRWEHWRPDQGLMMVAWPKWWRGKA